MKIAVVGGLGLIGHETVLALVRAGNSVVSFDLKNSESINSSYSGWQLLAERHKLEEVQKAGPYSPEGASLQADYDSCALALDKFGPDVVLNLGGNSLATEFRDIRRLSAETMTSLNQNLVAYTVLRQRRYVYVSSSMTYGNFVSPGGGQREDASQFPLDPYGAMKLGCEKIILSAAYQHPGWDFSIARPSAVYGAFDTNERVIVKLLHKASRGEELTVANLHEALDFSYVEDVAGMLATMAVNDRPVRDVFNVSNGQSSTIGEVVNALSASFPNLQVSVGKSEPDISRPRRGTLSNDKFQSVFSFHLSRSVQDGVKALVQRSKDSGLIP